MFGSREWVWTAPVMEAVVAHLAELDRSTLVVHGGAEGVDRMAHAAALRLGMPEPEVHMPDYRRYGRREAPKQRNTLMAELGADSAIGFWNGRSGGTWDMRRKAEQAGIPVVWVVLAGW